MILYLCHLLSKYMTVVNEHERLYNIPLSNSILGLGL